MIPPTGNSRNPNDLCAEAKEKCLAFIAACQEKNIRIIITQTFRSPAQQAIDYAQGRTSPGRIITNAKAGESKHNCIDDNDQPAAQAFDFAIYDGQGGTLDWDADDDTWKIAITVGETLGLKSGASFCIRDCCHMEIPS